HGVIMLGLTGLFDETLQKPVKASLVTIFKSYGEALCHKKLFIFAACVGLVSVFSYCFAAAAPFIAQNILHLNAADYGYWNILNMVGMFCGAIVASRLIKKYESVQILLAAITIIILGFIVMGLFSVTGTLTTIGFFGITAIAYFVSSWIFPTASHIASNAVDCKANASGAMNFINMGSAVLMVAIMGYLPFEALWGFIGVVLVFAVLCFIGVVTIFLKSNLKLEIYFQ
ncbi:MFS transporter, partial [Francisellaceae bacterium]|nr:MFS transporter [Francisellaceae bacterium]